MTKSITILALTCFLVLGAAATSILARSSIPPAGVAASVGDLDLYRTTTTWDGSTPSHGVLLSTRIARHRSRLIDGPVRPTTRR